jgi:hypothetical protein
MFSCALTDEEPQASARLAQARTAPARLVDPARIIVDKLQSHRGVIKVDYANGTGDGHIIWRLGRGGDFTLKHSGPYPWFSHQHDATYVNNNTLVLFDDGNVRRSRNPRAQSRGQELILNEKTMRATLVANVNLGSYAPALGSAQMLPNGNLDFDSGFAEQTIEALPNGTKTYVMKMTVAGKLYRSYIYATLYGDPANSSLPSTPISRRLAPSQGIRKGP